MADVSITMTVGIQGSFFFLPQAAIDLTGAGITAPAPINGSLPSTAPLDIQMDAAYLWDIYIQFKNADPIAFEGFNPGAGGDLLTLLSAQGWTP